MTGRRLIVAAWAFAGLLFAIALTAGAFALAGREIATPPGPVLTVSPAASNEPRHEESPSNPPGDRSDSRPGEEGESPGPSGVASSGSSTWSTGSTGADGGETPDRGSGDPIGSERSGSPDD